MLSLLKEEWGDTLRQGDDAVEHLLFTEHPAYVDDPEITVAALEQALDLNQEGGAEHLY